MIKKNRKQKRSEARQIQSKINPIGCGIISHNVHHLPCGESTVRTVSARIDQPHTNFILEIN